MITVDTGSEFRDEVTAVFDKSGVTLRVVTSRCFGKNVW